MNGDENHGQVDVQRPSSVDVGGDMDTLVLPARPTPASTRPPTAPSAPSTSTSFVHSPLNVVSTPKQQRSFQRWVATHRAISAVLAVLIVLAVGAGAAAYHFRDRTPTVTLYTAHTQTLNANIGAGGLTTPIQTLNIVYPVTATVLNVPVQVGSSVKKGDTLLKLDSADLQRQLTAAQGAYNAAQLNAGTPAGNAAVAAALAQLQAIQSLLNSPTYHNGNIVAPFAGEVTVVNVANGTTTVPNTTLLTMVDASSIVVKAQFPLEQRPLIQVGQAANVYPASAPGQLFPGKVTAINVLLTNTGSDTFEVDVTVPNPNLALFVGESVYARIALQQSAVAIPELAVVNPDADSVVFVYSDGRAHIRHVTVGLRDGDLIGILSGIQDGDQVILVGQYQLTDNEKVNVRNG
jgi:multidrug efflux pump subunit AcrA (membrane-fusion protein)